MNLHTNYKDLTCAILYDIFYLFLRMQIEDPWNVDTLEEFLYYCCPECKDERIQNKADFIKHALEEHPKSKDSVTKIIRVKKEIPTELKNFETFFSMLINSWNQYALSRTTFS